MDTISVVIAWLLAGFLGALELVLLVLILLGRIKLDRLISEPNGDASLSRFQFLVFTFVIATSLFWWCWVTILRGSLIRFRGRSSPCLE